MTVPDALRQKAAGLLVVRLGSNMAPPRRAEADAEAVGALLDRYALGGLIVFNGTWAETRETLIGLQRRARRPLLVTSDLERGPGQQLAGAPLLPHAAAFGAVGEGAEAAIEAAARGTAAVGLAAGIHVNLTPVADVDRNPENPIIGIRAFAQEPERAGRLAAAHVRGAQAAGGLSSAKHFPGHGGTREDSHAVLPVVADTLAELERTDLVPFEACIEAGVELVMTAHVAFPALDPSGRPATLSRPILTDLLRGRLGFEGVVISDSLYMGGIAGASATEAALAVEQIAAGVDLLLDPMDPEAIIEGVAAAVLDGALPEARLDEALARADALRHRLTARFGPDVFTAPPPAPAADLDALADTVAQAAVTELRSPVSALPEGALVVMLRPLATPFDPPEQPLGAALRALRPDLRYAECGPDAGAEALARVEAEALAAPAVCVVAVARPAAWHGFGLRPEQAALVRAVAAGARGPLTLAALGSPRGLDGLGDAPALCTFSDVPAAQRALARRLAGGPKG